jgi:hypothetical protein
LIQVDSAVGSAHPTNSDRFLALHVDVVIEHYEFDPRPSSTSRS